MRIERITDIMRLVELWEFFLEGHSAIVRKTGFQHDSTTFLKNLLYILALKENGYVSVAFDGERPVGFGSGYDKTFLSGPRGFCVYAAYADSRYNKVLQSLMDEFHAWCRDNGVEYYIVSSLRKSQSVYRCFTRRYKFEPEAMFFKKEITNVN